MLGVIKARSMFKFFTMIRNFSLFILFVCFLKTVPRKFLTHILKELSERAILKLKGSSDYSWTVNVTKTPKGAVRFNGGWQEFLKDNSLGHGDFLVFTYDGKMQFSIDIFDNTACHRIDDKINPNSISSSGDDSGMYAV